MSDSNKIGECELCTADNVELTAYGDGWFCPYCMISYISATAEGKTLSQMFNILEKRLKQPEAI